MPFFDKTQEEKKEIFDNMRSSYSQWKEDLKELNKPFFAIHSDFEYQFLRNISGGALKLYLYLGFRAKYQTGETWETIDNAAKFFRKDPRTIANWFKELEENGLIFRGQQGFNMKANTFLRPYGFLFEEIKPSQPTTLLDIEKHIELSKEFGQEPKFGLLLNYAFKEYTFVLAAKKDNLYHCSYFIKFDESKILQLKKWLRTLNIFVDNYDIDTPISKSSNRKALINKYLNAYIREESGVI